MKKILVLSVLLLAMVFLTGAGNPAGQAIQRPIEDFVDAQGTFCIGVEPNCFLFVPPVENFFGWTDPVTGYAMSVDYAGLADDFVTDSDGVPLDFGTEFRGSITERPLPDGRAEVHVRLHTSNALTFVADSDFFIGDLLFGTRWDENGVLEDEPTLGDSSLQVVFINTAPGEPLPDLLKLFVDPDPGQEPPSFIGFNANVNGPLQPDGTPGRAIVVQRGLFMASSQAPAWDGFPVERIKLQAVGQ